MTRQFEIQRSKTFLYVIVATFLATLVLVAKLVLDHLDTVLTKLRRKQLWMTVSLVRIALLMCPPPSVYRPY